MANTKETTAEREAAQLAQVTAALEAAVREAIVPLVARIEALETALAGARTAFRDLRAKVQHAPVKPKPAMNWSSALTLARRYHGLSERELAPRGTIESFMDRRLTRDDVLAAEEARACEDIPTDEMF